MKILADYHTHTKYSHGKGTIEENVKVAISRGIEVLGISDHGYQHLTYGIKKDDIFKMREEVDYLNEKYNNQIKILLGVECNILDEKGNIDINEKMRDVLDYVMAGYHFGSMPRNIKGLFNHADNYIFKSKKSKDYNTLAVINAMKNNDIFVITHPGDKGDVYIEEILIKLFKICTGFNLENKQNYIKEAESVIKNESEKCRYPKSATKILQMLKGYRDGFVSFWQ